jgi:hypothetical protein
LELSPLGVRPIKLEAIKNEITLEQENRNIIGDLVEIKFVNLPANLNSLTQLYGVNEMIN